MQLSSQGLAEIIKREGCVLHAYKDSRGVWTIGTGHTSAAGPPAVKPGMVITKAQNDEILRRDLKPVETMINSAVKVPLSQNQYDSLVSIVFNTGPKFLKGTAIRFLNEGNYSGCAKAIMLWNKPSEIIGRRKSEQRQFLTPDGNKMSHSAAGAVLVGGGVVLSQTPHHVWPWIIAGTAVAALAVWFGIYLLKGRK